ncbi:hypothetical protein Dd703_1371 [Musicola paradisiaca Ech703]|uniref:Uncharacterized protein n=1 Tax=Musicola paradisiaca (strain Ech703) TaxID=579405 RepID=C6CDQ6_MUSP7|nr:hypothetical protein Dd703_1371 [Musicola paradisiaca Ech703]
MPVNYLTNLVFYSVYNFINIMILLIFIFTITGGYHQDDAGYVEKT